MLKGNKGEWSEIYVFLKLLGDKRIFAADKDLLKIPDIFYPVLSIIREENERNLNFLANDIIKIMDANSNSLIKEIPIKKFQVMAEFLFDKITKDGSSASSFAINEMEEFLKELTITKIKESSNKTRDITIKVHDLKTNTQPELGFSIKSRLGSPSTLLNAGKTTNFVYKIQDKKFSDKKMLEINSITGRGKIKRRLDELQSTTKILYHGMENENFKLNLELIDSKLPEIIAFMILDFFSTKRSKIKDICVQLKEVNPCGFNLSFSHPFYEYKIKRMLSDIALGMQPASLWDGYYDATGGYIIVREDGEVLCYHIYNKNEFWEYLFENTKFETASSSRHDFGTIYTEDGDYYFKLNLQIRFYHQKKKKKKPPQS